MIVLSPPLFLAALYQVADEADHFPGGDLRLGWSGRLPPDIALVHRVGLASHRDPVAQSSRWPFVTWDTADAFRRSAARDDLSVDVPSPGDFVVTSSRDGLIPDTVAMVLTVVQRGSRMPSAPAECKLLFATGDVSDPGWLNVCRVRRWCGAARGDVVIRWADWEQEVAA